MVDIPDALQRSLADRYRIEHEIGAGGMATVYRAHDIRHGRAVALKVLRPDVAAAMGIERFKREVTLTAALQHPHILALFDSGDSAGYLYYVAPYIDGESLQERLVREGQLPIDEALEIVRQIADALDYAHHLGIVHRDIKPANILLAAYEGKRRAHALVADFGIARALRHAGDAGWESKSAGARHPLTETGFLLGTPRYMSPEQMLGDGRIDGRSDVYSLACVAFEMLAGEPPFPGVTAEGLVARIRSASVPSIAAIRAAVPTSVDEVILRGLNPIAADRFATAGEFAAALTGAFASPGRSHALPGGRAGRAASGLRRTLRSRVAAIGAAGLALIAVAGWAWITLSNRAAPVETHGTRDPEAALLARQAQAEIERRTEVSVARGVDLLQRAIERDSNFADAWAELVRALVFAQNNRYNVPGIPRTELVAYAVRAGERALEADSTSATAWLARGRTLYLVDPTTRRGISSALYRAIELDPNSADAWHYLGNHYEDVLDTDSALISFQRSIEIRPNHPQSLAFLGLHYMWLRQPEQALTWADSAAASNPTNILARQTRGLVLIQQGRVAEAEDDFTAVVGMGQGPERVWGWTGLAVIAWRRHDLRAADSLSARATADADTLRPSHHEAVYLAWMYAETGQHDRALAVLERFARPRHLHFQLHLRREFTLDLLRREPRFMALVRSDSIQRSQ